MQEEKRDKLILENLALVKKVIKTQNYSNFSEYEDVYSEGIIGLINAVNIYDETKGSFSTLAWKCIKTQILIYLSQTNKLKNRGIEEISLEKQFAEDDFETSDIKDTETNTENEAIHNICYEKFLEEIEDPVHRDIFMIYCYSKDYTKIKQVAIRHSLSISTLYSILQQLITRFKQTLQNN